MIDFSKCPISQRVYGGAAGRKLGIIYNNEYYMLKFPGNLKEQNLKNIELSYSNAPISEYIGSQIISSIGLPVHETLLGQYGNKIVVACKDFVKAGCRLQEFEKYKITFNPKFLDSNGNETNGTGTDLQEILLTIKEHTLFQDKNMVEARFWDMFVVDTLIGNTDRNNGNWGFIIDANEKMHLAPIYDNGNCLNNKWDDKKMNSLLQSPEEMRVEPYTGRRCVFLLNNKRINPYKILQDKQYEGANSAIIRIVPHIDMDKIKDIIYNISDEIVSPTRKEFYTEIMNIRYKEVLLPLYQELTKEKELSFEEKLDRLYEETYNGFSSYSEVIHISERT